MKPVIIFKHLVFIGAAIYSFTVLGYEDDKKKEICRAPKIQEFTLPEYSDTNKKEAPPEAEFTFVVSGWANPKKFKLNAKNVEIPFTVQSTETFHKIKAKLPAALTGQTVRINARIPALLDCYSTIGWLVKVADKPTAVVRPAPSASTPTTNATGAAAPTVQEEETAPKAAAPVPAAAPAASPEPANKPTTVE